MWAAGVEEAVVAGAAEASVAAEDLVAAVGADLVVVAAAAALVAVDLAVAAAALVAVVAVGALVAGVAHENCHCSSHHSLYSDTFMRTGSLFVFRDGTLAVNKGSTSPSSILSHFALSNVSLTVGAHKLPCTV